MSTTVTENSHVTHFNALVAAIAENDKKTKEAAKAANLPFGYFDYRRYVKRNPNLKDATITAHIRNALQNDPNLSLDAVLRLPPITKERLNALSKIQGTPSKADFYPTALKRLLLRPRFTPEEPEAIYLYQVAETTPQAPEEEPAASHLPQHTETAFPSDNSVPKQIPDEKLIWGPIVDLIRAEDLCDHRHTKAHRKALGIGFWDWHFTTRYRTKNLKKYPKLKDLIASGRLTLKNALRIHRLAKPSVLEAIFDENNTTFRSLLTDGLISPDDAYQMNPSEIDFLNADIIKTLLSGKVITLEELREIEEDADQKEKLLGSLCLRDNITKQILEGIISVEEYLRFSEPQETLLNQFSPAQLKGIKQNKNPDLYGDLLKLFEESTEDLTEINQRNNIVSEPIISLLSDNTITLEMAKQIPNALTHAQKQNLQLPASKTFLNNITDPTDRHAALNILLFYAIPLSEENIENIKNHHEKGTLPTLSTENEGDIDPEKNRHILAVLAKATPDCLAQIKTQLGGHLDPLFNLTESTQKENALEEPLLNLLAKGSITLKMLAELEAPLTETQRKNLSLPAASEFLESGETPDSKRDNLNALLFSPELTDAKIRRMQSHTKAKTILPRAFSPEKGSRKSSTNDRQPQHVLRMALNFTPEALEKIGPEKSWEILTHNENEHRAENLCKTREIISENPELLKVVSARQDPLTESQIATLLHCQSLSEEESHSPAIEILLEDGGRFTADNIRASIEALNDPNISRLHEAGYYTLEHLIAPEKRYRGGHRVLYSLLESGYIQNPHSETDYQLAHLIKNGVLSTDLLADLSKEPEKLQLLKADLPLYIQANMGTFFDEKGVETAEHRDRILKTLYDVCNSAFPDKDLLKTAVSALSDESTLKLCKAGYYTIHHLIHDIRYTGDQNILLKLLRLKKITLKKSQQEQKVDYHFADLIKNKTVDYQIGNDLSPKELTTLIENLHKSKALQTLFKEKIVSKDTLKSEAILRTGKQEENLGSKALRSLLTKKFITLHQLVTYSNPISKNQRYNIRKMENVFCPTETTKNKLILDDLLNHSEKFTKSQLTNIEALLSQIKNNIFSLAAVVSYDKPLSEAEINILKNENYKETFFDKKYTSIADALSDFEEYRIQQNQGCGILPKLLAAKIVTRDAINQASNGQILVDNPTAKDLLNPKRYENVVFGRPDTYNQTTPLIQLFLHQKLSLQAFLTLSPEEESLLNNPEIASLIIEYDMTLEDAKKIEKETFPEIKEAFDSMTAILDAFKEQSDSETILKFVGKKSLEILKIKGIAQILLKENLSLSTLAKILEEKHKLLQRPEIQTLMIEYGMPLAEISELDAQYLLTQAPKENKPRLKIVFSHIKEILDTFQKKGAENSSKISDLLSKNACENLQNRYLRELMLKGNTCFKSLKDISYDKLGEQLEINTSLLVGAGWLTLKEFANLSSEQKKIFRRPTEAEKKVIPQLMATILCHPSYAIRLIDPTGIRKHLSLEDFATVYKNTEAVYKAIDNSDTDFDYSHSFTTLFMAVFFRELAQKTEIDLKKIADEYTNEDYQTTTNENRKEHNLSPLTPENIEERKAFFTDEEVYKKILSDHKKSATTPPVTPPTTPISRATTPIRSFLNIDKKSIEKKIDNITSLFSTKKQPGENNPPTHQTQNTR